MNTGPRNELVRKRQLEILQSNELPPIKTIAEWRRAPDAREFARRYQVWELLAWYHHEVLRPDMGIRGGIRRLWNWVRGKSPKNLSPWEQLKIRESDEARIAALEQLNALREEELHALEAELDAEARG